MKKNDELLTNYAELIVMAGSNLLSYLYDKEGLDLVQWLLSYVKSDDSNYSKEYIIDKVENGLVKGMILALPAIEVAKKSRNELKVVRRNNKNTQISSVNILKWLWRMRIGFHFPRINYDEYYISELAVYENYRGQGIGEYLLLKAEEKAKEHGYTKMSLFVDIGNDSVKYLYEKNGYKVECIKRFPRSYHKHNLLGFYKMVKDI